MTTAVLDNRHPAAPGFASLAALALKIAAAINRHHAYLETCRDLSSLTDRELADIGITRAEIELTARRAVQQS